MGGPHCIRRETEFRNDCQKKKQQNSGLAQLYANLAVILLRIGISKIQNF